MEIIQTAFRERGPEFFYDTDYSFKGFLGEGSFGAVYKALHHKTNKIVAVKVNKTEQLDGESRLDWLKRMKEDIEDFETEHQTLRKLIEAPNCLTLLGYLEFKQQHRRAIMVTCCEGSLDKLWLNKELDDEKLFTAWRHVLRALRYLGEIGMAHRDVHPGNIMYAYSSHSKRLTFLLGDFGTAATIGKKDERAGAAGFRPPEMINEGPSTETSDVFSLFTSIAWCANLVKLDKSNKHGENARRLQDMRDPMFRHWMDCAANDWRKRPSARQLVERCKELGSFRGDSYEDEIKPLSRADSHASRRRESRAEYVEIAPRGMPVRESDYRQETARPRRRESCSGRRADSRADYIEIAPRGKPARESEFEQQETARPSRRESRRESQHGRGRADSRAEYIEIAPRGTPTRDSEYEDQRTSHQTRRRASSRATTRPATHEIAPRGHEPRTRRSSSAVRHGSSAVVDSDDEEYEEPRAATRRPEDEAIQRLQKTMARMSMGAGPKEREHRHVGPAPTRHTVVVERGAPASRRTSMAADRPAVVRRQSVQGRREPAAEEAPSRHRRNSHVKKLPPGARPFFG